MSKKSEATPKKRLTKAEKEKSTLRKLSSYIKKTNAEFEAMTPAQKRVQIAKDVIFQLDIGRIKGGSVYFDAPKPFFKEYDKCLQRSSWDGYKPAEKPDVELQDLFSKMPSCTVCGIGSVFVSAVDRLDQLKASDTDGLCKEPMVAYLQEQKIFCSEQLDLIENAFEGYDNYATVSEAGGFAGSSLRLRTVMELIIAAKGVVNRKTFKSLVYLDETGPVFEPLD